MLELKQGQTVRLTVGGEVRVIKELGRGGQGIVYMVELDGRRMALKWYLTPMSATFYRKLESDIHNGAPSDAFLWPKYITVPMISGTESYFGYLMDLRPEGYYEFGSGFLRAKTHFRSYDAMLAAAMRICEGFENLHRSGYSYQDLNDGNFFINPDTGDVLICDNDNVMPQGENSGIMGKSRYMAPEVVLGEAPDKWSDRYSLSVILFMLFFMNHPLEGSRVLSCPCMTEKYDRIFYGSDPLFIFDADDRSNLPVRGVHKNVLRRWPVFPSLLKDIFIQEFSRSRLKNKTSRMAEREWRKQLSRVRDLVIRCPHCGQETFAGTEASCKCINCGAGIDSSRRIRIGNRTLPLVPGTQHYIDSDNTPDVKVVVDARDHSSIFVQNLTPLVWTVETPSGKIKTIEPKGLVPAISGIKISFTPDVKGEIIA